MSISPPQVSPTENAVSSLIPYRFRTTPPLAMTSPASSWTAPSTQPPETLPTTSPAGETAMAAPGSRGALLNVLTTVARPNVSPASHHFEIKSRMSRTAHITSELDDARAVQRTCPERSAHVPQP